MRSRGCKPDAAAFSSLLNALAGGGQWQRALHIFGRLQVHVCCKSSWKESESEGRHALTL